MGLRWNLQWAASVALVGPGGPQGRGARCYGGQAERRESQPSYHNDVAGWQQECDDGARNEEKILSESKSTSSRQAHAGSTWQKLASITKPQPTTSLYSTAVGHFTVFFRVPHGSGKHGRVLLPDIRSMSMCEIHLQVCAAQLGHDGFFLRTRMRRSVSGTPDAVDCRFAGGLG